MNAYSKSSDLNISPHIVFFSGGTALRGLSREIIKHTYNSIHLVTVFDSGGSSAALRKSFDMLAIGDIRNRLLALADLSIVPQAAIDICNLRLPSSGLHSDLLKTLHNISSESYYIWNDIPQFWGDPIRFYLSYFLKKMPSDFNPSYASIGNLVLVGAFIYNDRCIESTIKFFSNLLYVRGTVAPIVGDSLHLAALLDDKSYILGQHNITANNYTDTKRIAKLFITKTAPYYIDTPAALHQDKNSTNTASIPKDLAPSISLISTRIINHLSSADLICYPMGSFFTSIISNLLPEKVGHTIGHASCAKVYIPNIGYDSEQANISVAQAVQIILEYLRKDAGNNISTTKLLNKVIIDSKNGLYAEGIDFDGLNSLGVEVCDVPLIRHNNQVHDPKLTANVLLSHCKNS